MRLQNPWNQFKVTLTIAVIVISTLLLSGAIISLGRNIPPPINLTTDYLIGVIWSVIIGISICFWQVSVKDKPILLTLWVIRTITTLGFMPFYEAYYQSLDSYTYFNLPRLENFYWSNKIGTESIYNLVWLYYKIMPDSFHALKVSFSLLGLIGAYLFYRASVLILNQEDLRLLYLFALYPSILFWSSIIGKDPISFFAIALFTYGVIGYYRQHKFKFVGFALIGLLIATIIRSWLFFILLVPTFVLFFISLRQAFLKAILLFCSSIIFALGFKSFQTQFGIYTYDIFISRLYTWVYQWNEMWFLGQDVAGYFIRNHQAIPFLPLGMFLTLFRPFPGDLFNPFSWLSWLENLPLLILLFLAITKTRLPELKDPLIIWGILLVLSWALFYAFMSSGRWRVQILPILLGLLLYLGRNRSLTPTYEISSVNHEPN